MRVARREVHHIDTADKMDALLVEAVPTRSVRSLRVSLPIQLDTQDRMNCVHRTQMKVQRIDEFAFISETFTSAIHNFCRPSCIYGCCCIW